jgi:hypothetical protein
LLTDYPEVIAWIPISGWPTTRELSSVGLKSKC